ncbi:PDR/VanB family oxidoreductase [Pseudomonas sp. ZM23]|uniref:PDR/VanB family oxidoreductase n=1 Tax=Pseudomonas triclosanedens TaxID=2961893 RepID=A0ABY6ZVR7_9PSED|nr:PDR/VanB family oxidoreductase [Pseudomonas triclosanedens]MCP8465250.1 PDR/VanB family oxidoreductase [Pseudomonas triclosanedens]MCP8470810.1 PDR/VanB family oxidoreductase [Pseudomonas triclosanedens]MCP8476499.1 PDR/VanB family oxidoreductase [Pseudomonas triclosanedens]WAI48994.1 PDR/VanB family oxidoreductase [Pseudomonas triclosanedens]
MLDVVITRLTRETPDILSLELARADAGPLPAFSAGSHIDLHLPNGLVRQYSLFNAPDETHRYRIAVLRCADSRGGSLAVHELAAGQALRIGPPRNLFPLAEGTGRRLLLAGGIGITPLLSMAEHLASQGAEFELHYCARSAAQAAFVEHLAQCKFATRVHCHFDDGDPARRLDMAALLAAQAADAQLYTCGPAGFMAHVLDSARALGWDESRLHHEHFGAEPDVAGEAFEVQLASSGQVVRVEDGQSVVDALRGVGVEVQVACEQGICGTCLTRVLDGVPEHRDQYLTEDEQAANDQFTPCCSRSRSPRLVLDL